MRLNPSLSTRFLPKLLLRLRMLATKKGLRRSISFAALFMLINPVSPRVETPGCDGHQTPKRNACADRLRSQYFGRDYKVIGTVYNTGSEDIKADIRFFRDGVKIWTASRTMSAGRKYDIYIIEAASTYENAFRYKLDVHPDPYPDQYTNDNILVAEKFDAYLFDVYQSKEGGWIRREKP